jgi:hypothetical protein
MPGARFPLAPEVLAPNFTLFLRAVKAAAGPAVKSPDRTARPPVTMAAMLLVPSRFAATSILSSRPEITLGASSGGR